MKHLLTAALLFIASFVSAQIVNIPDPGFKQYLLEYIPAIDTNGDGEIQESEAQALTYLYLDGNANDFTNITGVRSFSNLDSLLSVSLKITDADLSGMTSLRYTELSGRHIHTVNASNCSNLQYFFVDDVNGNPDSVTNLNLSGNHKLKEVYIETLNVPELDLHESDSLLKFTMLEGDINGMLNLSGLTKFKEMYFDGHIGAINAINDTALNIIWGGWNGDDSHVDDLFVTNCTGLEEVWGFTFDGTYLDVSSCYRLWALDANCTRLRYLNIKNGHAMPVSLLQQNLGIVIDNPNPQSLYVCADDNEVADVLNALTQMNGPSVPITVNSFCSPSPGGAYNTIKGKVRVDVNNNGCDNADEEIANVPVRVFNGTYYTVRYSNVTGDYQHYDFVGNFTVTPYFPYPYFSISPLVTNIVFDTANNIIHTLDFCITPQGTHNQLEITFLPIGGARPGFPAHYQLMYRNRGTTTLSGNVQLNFDFTRMNYSAASVTPSSQSTGLLNWNYSNFLPLENRYIDVTFSLLPPPANIMGDTLRYLAVIDPVATDETPADNSFILPQRMTNSNDPNEKTCLEGEKLDITRIADNLHYVIHFQNTGTDTAFTVVLTDTLTNNLDWESFDFLGSSHPCFAKRTDNKLEFYFQNIKLPYQAINDAGSNGFVAFEIKPKSTLVIGDSINNTASIYFDFNPPVVTNKATTIVSLILPVPVKLEYFSLSSKEEKNLLTWKVATTDLSTTFNIERSNDGIHFTNIGNITATAQRCQLPFNFTDDKPLNGKNYYRIKITDANAVSFYSKILVTGRTKSGFEITAIANGQNNTILYMDVSTDQHVQMKIIAADGRLVYSQSKTIVAGTNQLNLQTGNLSKGIYTLVVYTNDGEVITKRFVR